MEIGCQGSTWVLDYDQEEDIMDKVMDDVKQADLTGVDVQVALLGRYKNKPEELKEELEKRNLKLAALTIPHDFPNGESSPMEKKLTNHYLNYLKYFPGAIMNIPSRVGKDRSNLLQRQKEIISGANILGKLALEEYGVVTSFHPNSYTTSYWRFKSDYEVLFDGLNPKYMGYTPDSGHIEFGGMEASKIIEEALPIIKHVHFKDVNKNKEWKKMGEGDIDIKKCVEILKKGDYEGWIILEEETGENKDTSLVIEQLGEYAKKNISPLIK